ncbi:MAG: cytochrome c-type biogenesis protein CcmH, partial [Acidimicrobiia bacterium]
EIEDFFVARYGEWVLLDPGPRGVTLALWVLPMLALVVGVFAILARRRRLPRRELTEDERRRVAEAIRRLGRTEEDE